MVLPWDGFEGSAVRLADAKLGTTLDDERVRQWSDQGPRNNTTSQFVAQRRPRYTELGGEPALLFDGIDDALVLESGVTGVAAGDSLTTFTVARFDPGFTEVFDSGFFDLGVSVASSNTGLSVFHEGPGLTARMVNTDLHEAWFNDGETHVFEVVHTSASRAMWVDGFDLGGSFVAADTPAGIDSLVEGALGKGAFPFKGWLHSNLIFSAAFSDSTRATIRERLRLRFISKPPEVRNWEPPEGSAIATEQPVSFEVVGDIPLALIVVGVRYPSGAFEIAWDGNQFAAAFRARSSFSIIAGGLRFTIRRFGLWLGDPTIEVRAVDAKGRMTTTNSRGQTS